jgi:alanyl-tRNA synthetase
MIIANKQQTLYLDDPFTLEFQTNILETTRLPDGRWGVILDRSYFYPTGGGQEHDTGTLGEAQVIEVYKQDDPSRVVHVVDRPLPAGPAMAKINSERRQRHMQHHTAQHLLTQCFVHLFGLDTLSANINGYTPATLDLPGSLAGETTPLTKSQLEQAENLANQLIYEDRPVRSYFVTAEQLDHLPLRRAPKVSEDIRIVEIEGFDVTPCGGTHCSSTGQIGVIKITKTEKQNERTRVHFTAGWQALQLFQANYETVSGLAGDLSVAVQDLPATVNRLAEGLQKAQKELQALQLERLAWEAGRLAEAAETIHGRRTALAIFAGRPVSELRLLAGELAKYANVVGVLVSIDGQKVTIAAVFGESTGISARDLLPRLLAPFNGRGGGDARLAQGGGIVAPEQIGEIEIIIRKAVEEALAANESRPSMEKT